MTRVRGTVGYNVHIPKLALDLRSAKYSGHVRRRCCGGFGEAASRRSLFGDGCCRWRGGVGAEVMLVVLKARACWRWVDLEGPACAHLKTAEVAEIALVDDIEGIEQRPAAMLIH